MARHAAITILASVLHSSLRTRRGPDARPQRKGYPDGGHFAPDGDPHGSPDSPPAERHVGDLGNI